MAVATECLVALLAERAAVKVLVISVRRRQGLTRHLARAAKTVRAVEVLAVARFRSGTLYVGSDAGLGMCYTLLVVAAGRALHYRVFLHHHSAAYVDERSSLMAAIVRSGGTRCTHVLSCDDQAAAFDARYRTSVRSITVPVSFALGSSRDEDTPAAAARPPRPNGRWTLGHLSNLSVEKGVERAFQTLNAAVAAGLDAHLVVAGPPATLRDEAVLTRLLAQAGHRARYVGPVDDASKPHFFGQIDVFLFPSLYRHESFGLVAWEAMQAGIPLIAYRAGCLTAELVQDGGLVLEASQDYAAAAVQQLRRWNDRPDELRACASAAVARASAARDEGLAAAAALVERLTTAHC